MSSWSGGLGAFLRKVRAGTVPALVLAACSSSGSHPTPPGVPSDAVDWPAFLARLDPLWNTLPPKWDSAALTGNGLMGATIFLTDDGKALRWHLGRTDVIYANERIPVGDLIVAPSAPVQGGQLRLDLWNAEVTGALQTSAGTLRIRSFTHTDDLVQVVELTPDPGSSYALDWSPGLAPTPPSPPCRATAATTTSGCAAPATAALPRPSTPTPAPTLPSPRAWTAAPTPGRHRRSMLPRLPKAMPPPMKTPTRAEGSSPIRLRAGGVV